MRILMWHVHGSWTTSFVQGDHEYLLPVTPGRDSDGLGRAQTWDWPANAVEVPHDRLADTELLGPGDERTGVLGQAAAAEPHARVEELRADPLVEAQDSGEVGDIGVRRLADLGQHVHQRDPRGEHDVRGHLCQLGGRQVGAHDRHPLADLRCVDLTEDLVGLVALHAEDQPVRAQGVLDRVPLPEELRVPGDADPVPCWGVTAQPLPEDGCGADRNGGLAHDQRRTLQVRQQRRHG